MPLKKGSLPITSEQFRAALKLCHGNISAAAKLLGISKTHSMRLSNKFELRQEARRLRVSFGGSAAGRPPAA